MDPNITAYTFKDRIMEVFITSSHKVQGIFHHSGISFYFTQYGLVQGDKKINYQHTAENIIRTVNRVLDEKIREGMFLTGGKELIPVYRNNDSMVRVLSGKFRNVKSKILPNRTMIVLEVTLDQSSRFIIDIPEENEVLVSVNKTGKYYDIANFPSDYPLQISCQNGYLSILSPKVPVKFVIVSGKAIGDNPSVLIANAYPSKS